LKDSPPPPRQAFQEFIRARVPRLPTPPATLAGWDRRLASVREGLRRSFGRTPETPCDLAPALLGTLRRDGYAIERLTFQSRPGVRVTANLYRPDPPRGRYPAVLSVHGHWAWARIDTHVQPRCIGLAKLGYVCLCVDAFGAGERAVEPAPGTYHGGLLGASLWPAGVPLLGLQVYDNRRAVDYLLSRPEVNPARLAITGASGGGNQTLYAGATDDRLAAVVPVCGIGTYEAYTRTACCVCEVNVAGASYATTGDLLAMIAPRALLVVSATQDAYQFSEGEARKSLDYARERFRLLGVPEKVGQAVIESGHDYNRPMREALYGWLGHWLKGLGDGSAIAEPEMTLEDPSALRCYPDGPSRPKTVMTIPEFALREGRARLAALPPAPDHLERWEADAARMRVELRDRVLGGFPRRVPLLLTRREARDSSGLEITVEPGLRLAGESSRGRPRRGTLLILEPAVPQRTPEDVERESQRIHLDGFAKAGFLTLACGLRATGREKPETPAVAGVADHNEAEWALWIGRPLLGQWVWDAIRWLDALDEIHSRESELQGVGARPYTLFGRGPMGLVALLAAALDPRVSAVGVEDVLVSFVGEGPWAKVPMGVIAPNILDVGDVGHLAALVAPKRLVVVGGAEPGGKGASEERLREAFEFTRKVYDVVKAEPQLMVRLQGELPDLLSR
jgi:dienelactone hydrolase